MLLKKKDVRIFASTGVENTIREAYLTEVHPLDTPINGSNISIGNNLPNWEDTTLLNLALFLGWEVGFASPVCALELLDQLGQIQGWHIWVEEYNKFKEELFKKVL